MNMIHSKPVFKRNINKDLYKATISLRDNKNIVIRPADKNLGPTVLCRSWYVNKMIAQLEKENAYVRVNEEHKQYLDKLFKRTVPGDLEECKLSNHMINYICERK